MSRLRPTDRVQIKPLVRDVNGRHLVGGRLCTVLAIGNTNTDHETVALFDKDNVLIVVRSAEVEFLRHMEVA